MKRMYSLFENHAGKWVRISELAFPLATARRVFQSALLAPYLGLDVKGIRELHPVKQEVQP